MLLERAFNLILIVIHYNSNQQGALLTCKVIFSSLPLIYYLTSTCRGYLSVYIVKKPQDVFVNRKSSDNVKDLLDQSEKAIQAGDSKRAYDLSLRATQSAPQSIEAWLLRATLAPTPEERITCVNRLNELAPDYQDRYNVAFFALKELLDRNPFLAYLEETEELYRAINGDHVLTIPKKRAAVNSSPLEQNAPSPFRPAYRWLTLALVGLLFAGIGTVIFAPLAAFAAISAQRTVASRSGRVRSTIVLILSFLLFMIGVIFSLLFMLHWLG